MHRVLLIITATFVVAIAGCGSDSSSQEEAWAPFRFLSSRDASIRYENQLHPDASGLMGPELKPILPHEPPPSFLAQVFLIEGIGNFAHPGSRLTVQYVGADYETGKIFASSWDEGAPFTFILGKGEVVQAWEEALENGEVGDRVELVVPPDLTDGPFPPDVPKGPVIFVIELLRSEYPSEIEAREASTDAPPRSSRRGASTSP
jgi:hypothetical protein